MTQRERKLTGNILLIVLLAVYAGAAIVIFNMGFLTLPAWMQLGYFATAGILCAVPVGYLIKWMSGPEDGSA